MIAQAALVAIRISVLGIFSPTEVTLVADGKSVALALRDGALVVDGAARDRVRVDGKPLVTVAVIANGRARITRRFRGTVEARAQGGAIALIDEIADEEYLPGTVALEATSDHPEALKTQAVLARTFAARGARHAAAGFDLCDLTHCQTYRGVDGESQAARAAVDATVGEVVRFDGRIAEVYFTATCGGATADVADVWPDGGRRPYLRSVACDLCRRSPDREWRATVSRAELGSALDGATGLTVVDRGAGGTVRRVRLEGSGRTLTGEELRIALGRALGWSRVKSANFTVAVASGGDGLTFSGHGFGHGVGLCETGAAELARRGASYREILQRYFPGTAIDGGRGRR